MPRLIDSGKTYNPEFAGCPQNVGLMSQRLDSSLKANRSSGSCIGADIVIILFTLSDFSA